LLRTCSEDGYTADRLLRFELEGLAIAPQKQVDGMFLTLRSGLQFLFVVTERDTGEFVKALVVDLEAGMELMGVSETMTWPEWMEV